MACPNLKTYAEVRHEKLEKLNKYHTQDLLNKYTQFTGLTDNDNIMKDKYKQQLEKLNKKMLDMLSSDVSLLLEQHQELELKTQEVEENRELINHIRNKIETEQVSSNARLQNTTEMSKLQKSQQMNHHLLFYGNIVLFMLIILGIIFTFKK